MRFLVLQKHAAPYTQTTCCCRSVSSVRLPHKFLSEKQKSSVHLQWSRFHSSIGPSPLLESGSSRHTVRRHYDNATKIPFVHLHFNAISSCVLKNTYTVFWPPSHNTHIEARSLSWKLDGKNAIFQWFYCKKKIGFRTSAALAQHAAVETTQSQSLFREMSRGIGNFHFESNAEYVHDVAIIINILWDAIIIIIIIMMRNYYWAERFFLHAIFHFCCDFYSLIQRGNWRQHLPSFKIYSFARKLKKGEDKNVSSIQR